MDDDELSDQSIQLQNIQSLKELVDLNESPAGEFQGMVAEGDHIIKDKTVCKDKEKEFRCEFCPCESARRSSDLSQIIHTQG